MSRVVIVHHAPTDGVASLRDAVVAGANDDVIEGVEVVSMPALRPDAAAVVDADAVVLVTPANFGYMSGALKHFFDTIFLEAGGALSDDGSASGGGGGKTSYGLLVHGRYDTTGAIGSVQSIVQALPWTQAAEVVDVLGDVTQDDLDAAYELGATLSALASSP